MRKSGILMHLSSLPGPYGIGTLGKCAYDFIDFLHAGGQSYWQILPLSPTGFGDSPYQSLSSFAGNPYFIDLDLLAEQGLLTPSEIHSFFWGQEETKINFGCLYQNRSRILKLAFQRFRPSSDYQDFLEKNRDRINQHALFLALKEKSGGREWQTWPRELAFPLSPAQENHCPELSDALAFQMFLQYQFFAQWQKLRNYAHSKGVHIIGDVPIYVPLDSADVWANPHLFRLDETGQPKFVAGCPPDSFSKEGQLWGNPVYDWEKMRREGYRWWLDRLISAAQLYDVIRLDHFRGFESFWAVPAEEKTAIHGTWLPGPGLDFIDTVKKTLPDTLFIAEDLGYQTEEVKTLLQTSGWPGMKVIQFAFDTRETSDHLPHLYPVNSVCYSGTHDNPPLRQWLEEASPEDVNEASAYLGLHREEGAVWGMIRGCMSSVSQLVIIQMQDYLALGGAARMNTPGTLSEKNWSWRALPDAFSETLAKKFRTVTKRYGRL